MAREKQLNLFGVIVEAFGEFIIIVTSIVTAIDLQKGTLFNSPIWLLPIFFLIIGITVRYIGSSMHKNGKK